MILIMVMLMLMVSCAPMESNFSKFEQQLQRTQNELKISLEHIEDSFYIQELIREDQVYRMPENNYLVLFFTTGDTPEEEEFKKIIEEYVKDRDSFKVYTSHTDGDIRLEFITRRKKEYTLQDIWYDPSGAEQLPYRGE